MEAMTERVLCIVVGILCKSELMDAIALFGQAIEKLLLVPRSSAISTTCEMPLSSFQCLDR